MTPDEYRRATDLFDRLRELPPPERGAALDDACAGNAELRAQVSRLLAADRDVSGASFLEHRAIDDAARLLTPSAPELPPPGAVFGNYCLGDRIGAGGMGIVYEAQDLRLHRRVAVKVLPLPFASEGEERIKRFQREARAASLLTHPNIVSIFDADFDQGYYYMAMEFVEGQTLRQLIATESHTIDRRTLLDFIMQIAAALRAAHEAGIVHRDIKPENVMVRPDGFVKVLDFGMAKLREGSSRAGSQASELRTRPGSLAGTIQYLSPEQVAGKPVDGRSDIFSLGVVAYELATGQRPFDGPTDGAVFGAILHHAPPAPSTIQTELGADYDALILRALEKDRELRFQTAGDLRSSCKRLSRDSARSRPLSARSARTAAPAAPRAPGLWQAATAVLAAALLAAGIALWRATRPAERPLMRLSVDLGPDAMAGISTTVAISPDGQRLVFPARSPDGRQHLATRTLDNAVLTLLPGSAGGQDPFFSPDGQWIGFFADSKMKKVSVYGGAPVTLCDAPLPRGASWGDDGNIAASLNTSTPLQRVPEGGGTPQTLTHLGRGEATHRWPQVLPGGKAVIFTASNSNAGLENAEIQVVVLKTRVTSTLVRGGYYGRYLPSGHLVYVHQGALFGAPFDADGLKLLRAPTPLLEEVAGDSGMGGGQFDFSRTGTLVYLAGKGSAESWPIVWMDRSGKTQPLLAAPGAYYHPHISPDGRRLALTAMTKGQDIFVYDWRREAMTRLTFDGQSLLPVWTPDGKHIVFRSTSGGFGFGWVPSNGGSEPHRLLESQANVVPWSFSPDGRRLAFYEMNPETGQDIWTLPLDTSDPDHPKPGQPEPFLRTQFDERAPMFSPDGRWIAYASNESGAQEIYVRPFPGPPAGPAGKWRISNGGGSWAFWSKHRHELLYETQDNHIMAVDYTVSGDTFVPAKPRPWSDRRIFNPGTLHLDLAPDSGRFAVIAPPETGPKEGSVHVTFLLNFFDEMRRRLSGH
jgi:serine/threonine-protein kinase